MDLNALFNPAVLALLIPVIAMIGGVVTLIARHRERMAMIDRGIDPDTRMPISPHAPVLQQPAAPPPAVRR